MAEIDKHLLALAYGTVVSSGELQNSRSDTRNTTQLDSSAKKSFGGLFTNSGGEGGTNCSYVIHSLVYINRILTQSCLIVSRRGLN